MHVKSTLSVAALLLAGVAALTACDPDVSPSGNAAPSTHPAPASSAPARSTPPATPPSPSSTVPAGSGEGSGSGGSGGASAGGEATSDSYAWHHRCTHAQLSVSVVRRAGAPTQRIIAVRNLGARSCGLSYHPGVALYNGDSATGEPSVEVAVPDGLGGPPATPVYAGRTAYAVIDFDPSGDTEHAVENINTLNVVPDSEHMGSRHTLRYRLGAGDHVLHPKLGLYEDTVAAAVDSVNGVGPTR